MIDQKNIIQLDDQTVIILSYRRGALTPHPIIIDSQDLQPILEKVERINIYKQNNKFYPSIKLLDDKKPIKLSHFLLNPLDCLVDHANDNFLDCRRENMILAQNGELHGKQYKDKKQIRRESLRELPDVGTIISNYTVEVEGKAIWREVKEMSNSEMKKSSEGSPNSSDLIITVNDQNESEFRITNVGNLNDEKLKMLINNINRFVIKTT